MLRKRGLEVRIPEDSFVVQLKAANDVREFGPIDWAIVTNCTSRSRQSCLGPENLCSPALLCHRSATVVSSAFLQLRPLTLYWHGPNLHYEV